MEKKKEEINILIADDHTLYRKGLKALLNTIEQIKHIDEASDGKEAIKMLQLYHYDIILIDLEMPKMDGWATSRKILKKFPETKIIVISMHDSLQVISDLIEIGVHSYLLKNAELEDVKRAIFSVLNNEFYYNKLISKALSKKIKPDETVKTTINDLSSREIEVLQLICKEYTAKEIGEQLSITEQTILTHRKNLLKKTKVKNIVGLVKFAVQNSIIRL